MTLMHITVFLSGLAGFVALTLTMPKHCSHILRRNLSEPHSRLLRIGGWLLLGVSLALGIHQWRFGIGSVTWLGWLTIAGVALVFYLPNWSWQPENKTARQCPPKDASGNYAVIKSRASPAVTATLAAVLLMPLAGFTWQLLNTPDKPLLREDAVHGQIGPWTFTLAEKDQKAPEIVAMGIPIKAFVIRFCESCGTQIRMAYFKVRKPHSLRAAGNAFGGRGPEKTAEIPLPRAATLEDGLWLTVEGNNGEVYHQEFDIQRLSPALASLIQEHP
ncbi:MAG: DUF3325 domain-containing protein [Cellvibrionaceae bacterium]|nr:DUF3325 domain-containing protein [Cellvibrionaceae bacterium]